MMPYSPMSFVFMAVIIPVQPYRPPRYKIYSHYIRKRHEDDIC